MAGGDGLALIFPGQGAQVPGMGMTLVAEGRSEDLLEVAAAAGLDLRTLIIDGTAEELRATQAAQPALYYTGVALGLLLQQEGIVAEVAAGHSLGEYCALAVAGALDPTVGMGLVLARGRLMANAPEGTMAAVLGLDPEVTQRLCAEISAAGRCCVVANDNCPGQQVVSGETDALNQLAVAARGAGARRVVPLNVGGAFHSPLMAAAAREFAITLAQVEVRDPRFPVASGTSGALMTKASEIREMLGRQLASPVLWAQAVRAMRAAGVRRFVECGPGNTLAALVRRTAPDAEVIGIDSPERVKHFAGSAWP